MKRKLKHFREALKVKEEVTVYSRLYEKGFIFQGLYFETIFGRFDSIFPRRKNFK